MGLEEQLEDPARRLVGFGGRGVTLVNRTAKTDANGNVIRDEYGDVTYDEMTVATNAEMEFPGSPQFEQRVGGSDIELDALIFVRSDHDIYTGDESDTRAPTEIHDDRTGAVYLTRSFVDEHNGKFRIHATR